MRFRPCIDIHNGKVKQIVGSSLKDPEVQENYISGNDSSYYAGLFKEDKLYGGHIIKLCKSQETEDAAMRALKAFPGGMQIGGGISNDNCLDYLRSGASHVIVTSYIFSNGNIDMDNLKKLVNICGKSHLVIDLSSIERDGEYFIATDRWTKLTKTTLSGSTFSSFSDYCDEFLIHAISKEGKKAGIDENLVRILSCSPIPITYAGGISSYDDIERIKVLGNNMVDYTVGSSLDIFGGPLEYSKIKTMNY